MKCEICEVNEAIYLAEHQVGKARVYQVAVIETGEPVLVDDVEIDWGGKHCDEELENQTELCKECFVNNRHRLQKDPTKFGESGMVGKYKNI